MSGDTVHTPEQLLYEANLSYLENTYMKGMYIAAPVMMGTLLMLTFALRKHPLYAARLPYVIMTEIVAIFSMLWYFAAEHMANSPMTNWTCAAAKSMQYALMTLPSFVMIGRITLFIKIAQNNTWDLQPKGELFDKVLHWIGIVTAPKDFRRAELRLVLLRRQQGMSTSRTGSKHDKSMGFETHDRVKSSKTNDVTEAKSSKVKSSLQMSQGSQKSIEAASEPSLPGDTADVAYQRRTFIKDMFLWLSRMISFWVISILWLLFLYGIRKNDRIVFAATIGQSAAADDQIDPILSECGDKTTDTMEIIYFLVTIPLQLALVFWARKHVIRDSLGMLDELLIVQSIIAISYFSLEIIHTIIGTQGYEGTALDLGLNYLHTGVFLLQGLVTGLYPFALVIKRKFTLYQLRGTSFKNGNDVARLWDSEDGKALIQDITRRNFAIENTAFLRETDNLTASLKKFTAVCDKYITEDALFQLNLKSKLRQSVLSALLSKDLHKIGEKIKLVRLEVFSMLAENYKSEFMAASKGVVQV